MVNSRLYLIEIKDAKTGETGASEFVTTVAWTANQKLFAATMFRQLSVSDASCSRCPLSPSVTRPNITERSPTRQADRTAVAA
jgi:hypothetical protein